MFNRDYGYIKAGDMGGIGDFGDRKYWLFLDDGIYYVEDSLFNSLDDLSSLFDVDYSEIYDKANYEPIDFGSLKWTCYVYIPEIEFDIDEEYPSGMYIASCELFFVPRGDNLDYAFDFGYHPGRDLHNEYDVDINTGADLRGEISRCVDEIGEILYRSDPIEVYEPDPNRGGDTAHPNIDMVVHPFDFGSASKQDADMFFYNR